MLKSYKNTNVDFYENLHRKYFKQAKDVNKTKHCIKLSSKKQKISEKSLYYQIYETGLFDLTEHSNTIMLGVSKST
jgi:plasmid rolling circle replication initiator protein Rep